MPRLPLSQDRWFGKAPEQDDQGKAYRAIVDEIVKLCVSKGVYIMLELHWSNAGVWGEQIGQHSIPDEHIAEFWKDFAPIYANHPAVIYDLYNEPHDVSWDIWLNGGEITDRPNRRNQKPITFKAVGMQQLLDIVRAAGAKNLVVVGGLDWAYDFSGILEGRQLKDPTGNGLVYANHCYNNKNQAVETWIANMEKAAKKFPIIISEFGGAYYKPGEEPPRRRFGGMRRNDGDWLMRIMQAIEDHEWSYTAWDFHPAAGPTLISGWDYKPTSGFGVYVKQMLAGTLPRYTPPAPAESNSEQNKQTVYPVNEDSLMKRIIGNFLIVFSIVCAVLTSLWIRPILTDLPENPGERIRQQMFYGLLIAVILLTLECAMFLYGRYLRRRYPAEVPKLTKTLRERCLFPLVVSLGCSIAITILIFLANEFLEIKALFFVIGQGWVLAQLIFGSLGGIIGFKLGGGVITQVIMIAFNLLYYLALFYPVFRILAMDRNEEVTRYRLMKTLLIIFVSVHILMIFIMTILVRA